MDEYEKAKGFLLTKGYFMEKMPPPTASPTAPQNNLNGIYSMDKRDGEPEDRYNKNPNFQEYSDRRNVPRLRVKLEVTLDFFDPSKARITSVTGTVTSLSESGVTVILAALTSLPGNIYLEIWSPNKSPLLKGAAEVRWMRALPLGRGFEYGLHFSNISPPFDLPIRQFLSSLLTDKTANKDRRIKSTVHTEPFQLVNRHGRRIFGFIDRPVDSMVNTSDAFVVLPPAYGETKTGAVTLGYFFSVNGISAVRYDASDHVGESEGTILECTLKKMHDDLIDVITHLRKIWGARRVALVASSLAARVAIKVAAEDGGIQFLGRLFL
ncbi:MAG: PilZ domain-containing protein [Elusimicrobia bacterium]|nr:PilZ domain-containing protein [Elusimicrobiota bacterium]